MTTPALVVRHMSKTFGRKKKAVRALNDVSFSVDPGEIVGLIGPNGAGKSTLLRIMLGYLPGDEDASARIFGRSSEDLEVRAGLGYQGDSAYRAQNISVSTFLSFHAELTGSPVEGQVGAYLKEFNMSSAAERSLSALSKGMRQKIELILAFLGSPRIVFLDEPTASLDPPSVFELREFLLVQKKRGVTVFFSSHNLTEVEQVCSRVLFISDGSIIAEYDMTKRRAKGFLEKAFKKHLVERRETV